MTTRLSTCQVCNANPPAIGGLCVCCERDRMDAQRAAEQARERPRLAKAEELRRWRPRWRPDYHGGHGHGTDRF
jgi:hypothetical protein